VSNKPSYKTNDPRGWCGDISRGAALGRPSIQGTLGGKLYLQRVYLCNGGYDKNGTYFGHGDPLYWASSSDGEVDFMLRGEDRDAAKRRVLHDYPDARFFDGPPKEEKEWTRDLRNPHTTASLTRKSSTR
jgi:hypothetical protein